MQQHDTQHSNDPADPKRTSPPPAGGASESADGDVMNIIADVERHLQRIRDVQQNQEQELQSLAQRSDALSKTEADLQQQAEQLRAQQSVLEERSGELETQRQAIENERASLREQQEAWSASRAESEAAISARERKIEEAAHELKARVAEFNEEKRSLQEASSKLEQERAELNERAETAARERDELQQRIEQAERNVGELISKLEASEQVLEERDQKLAEHAERAGALEQQLQEKSREFDEQSKEFAARQSEFDALKQQSESSAGKLAGAQKKLSEMEQEREQSAARMKALDEELEASQQRIEELTKQAQSSESELKQRDSQLGESKKKLQLAGEKLQNLAATLEQQAPMLERGAAAMAQVQQQKKEIERLTNEVAKLRTATDTSEIERRDRRISELTEALRQARGQVAGGGGQAGQQLEKIEQLNAELEQAREELKRASVRLEQMAETANEPGNGGDEATKLALAERDARIEQLSAKIESLEHELETAGKGDQSGANDEQAAALRHRITELEQALQEAQAEAGKAKKNGPSGDALREKTRRLSAIAEHVKRRRDRLRRMRKLVQIQARAARAANAGSAGATPSLAGDRDYDAEARDREVIDRQRVEIEAAREALAASERQMVRKWARPRAVTTLIWLVLLMLANAAGSWLLARHYFPALQTASVDLRPQTRSGESLAGENAERWQQWHLAVLGDENFRRTLARRMGERRLDEFSRAKPLGRYLDEHLTVLAGPNGGFTLTLAGRKPGILAPALDVIATTLATESSQQMGVRGDDAWAVVENERTDSSGELRYASLNQWMLEDQRVMYSGIFFAVTLTLSIMVIWFIYTRLVRAKRIFDDDNVLIATASVFDES